MNVNNLPQGIRPVSFVAPDTTPSGPDHPAIWLAWRDEPERPGEQRDVAWTRLTLNLEKEESVLDLSGLGLSTLPPVLPPHIAALKVNQNGLETLPELPPGLKSLHASDCQLRTLSGLPSSLTHLYASNNQLTVFPTFPPGMLALDWVDLSSNRISAVPDSIEQVGTQDTRIHLD
ncbi:hypothetical protein HAX39_25575, partial [Citrobacter freundii]|nr:hypothetical protein [Citrobacter freundii]